MKAENHHFTHDATHKNIRVIRDPAEHVEMQFPCINQRQVDDKKKLSKVSIGRG